MVMLLVRYIQQTRKWVIILKSLSNKIDDVLRNSSHLTWLNDYKTYGYRSYVYQDKNILHELYEDYNLCMNDDMIRDEAFDYVINCNKDVGKAVSSFYGINSKYELSLLHSINDVVNSSVAMNAIFGDATATKSVTNNPTFMNAINNSPVAIGKYMALLAGLSPAVYSSINDVVNNTTAITSIFGNETTMNIAFSNSLVTNTVLNSSVAMNTITKSGEIMKIFAKNTADWSVKKPFIMKLNQVDDYIKNVYNVLTNTKYFKVSSGTYSSSGSVSNIDTYGSARYATNGFIACALGTNSKTTGYGCRLKINGDVIKEATYPNAPYCPNPVDASNVNAIAIPTATFEVINNHYTYIKIYIAT